MGEGSGGEKRRSDHKANNEIGDKRTGEAFSDEIAVQNFGWACSLL